MTEQIRIDAACACKTGLVRSNNEDNFYFAGHILDRKNSGLEETLQWSGGPEAVFAVFDGMGGEASGETAAYLAAAALRDAVGRRATENFLTQVCLKANRDICTYARRNRSPLMGSTAVMLAMDGDSVEIVLSILGTAEHSCCGRGGWSKFPPIIPTRPCWSDSAQRAASRG